MASQSVRNIGGLAYPRTGKRGVPQQFPRRLYEMLESASIELPSTQLTENTTSEGRTIIQWSQSGLAFRIADVSVFSSVILPKYFRTSKFSSFQRNLNLYGFFKVRRGPDRNMYAHPSFIRGRPELLSQLRKSTSPTEKKYISTLPRLHILQQVPSSIGSQKSFPESVTSMPQSSQSLSPRSVSPSLTNVLIRDPAFVSPHNQDAPLSTATILTSGPMFKFFMNTSYQDQNMPKLVPYQLSKDEENSHRGDVSRNKFSNKSSNEDGLALLAIALSSMVDYESTNATYRNIGTL